MPKILIVVTSHAEIDSEHRTGLWFEEFAIPYTAFRDGGIEVVTASPRGGNAPIDPRSREGAARDDAATAALERTLPLHEVGDALLYDAIFVPGGHGAMFDLATSLPLKTLLSEFDAQGKLVAAVCHGPAAFVDAIRAGEPATLVAGRKLTCFTDAEERAGGLQSLMPYLLASKLREQGAVVIEAPAWQSHVEIDGTWITGQNPQSSAEVANAVITALRARVAP